MKRRRADGKFGRDPVDNGKSNGNNGRFTPGNTLATGRPKGSKNKLKAEIAALLATMPGYAEGARPPEDDLECLQWVKMHPLASLELIADVAAKRAKFFHRTLRDDKITHSVGEDVLRQITEEGRENARRERERRAAAQGDKEPQKPVAENELFGSQAEHLAEPIVADLVESEARPEPERGPRRREVTQEDVAEALRNVRRIRNA